MTSSLLATDARARFRARLDSGPILADGGMGTLLFARGIPQRTCLDELPTTRSQLIGAIHREFIEAGAELIETVSFGANRLRLGAFDLGSRAHAFNRRAAQVAREAIADVEHGMRRKIFRRPARFGQPGHGNE